jgi:hypothetical protein
MMNNKRKAKPASLPKTARAYLTRAYNLKMETEYAAVGKLIEIDASKKEVNPAWNAWPTSDDQPKKPINLDGWKGWVVHKLLGKVEIYNV